MKTSPQTSTSRRVFLRFLAGSPLLLAAGNLSAMLGERDDQGQASMGSLKFHELEARIDEIVASPQDASNVFDFEPVASVNLPPAHYGYLATGVVSDRTLHANREAFSRIYLRPLRLVDVSEIDMTTELFGISWTSPIVLAPAGSQKSFHEKGEIAVARAARTQSIARSWSSLWMFQP